ncbi:hypothetical protein TSOC_009244, partial [Tetrabaena socialis]
MLRCASLARCGPALVRLRPALLPVAPAARTAAGGVGPRAPRGRVVAFSHHSKEELEEVAQERFGQPYDTLDTDQKKAVGGVIGGRAMREAAKYVAKSKAADGEARLAAITDRIATSEQFVAARAMIQTNPTEALRVCEVLLRTIPPDSQ